MNLTVKATDKPYVVVIKTFYQVNSINTSFSGYEKILAKRKYKELKPSSSEKHRTKAVEWAAMKIRNVVIRPERTNKIFVAKNIGDLNAASSVESKKKNDKRNPINNPIYDKLRQLANEKRNVEIIDEARRNGLLSESSVTRKGAKSIVDRLLGQNLSDFCPDIEERLNLTLSNDVVSLCDLLTKCPQVTHGLCPARYNPNIIFNASPFYIKALPLLWIHGKRQFRRGVL